MKRILMLGWEYPPSISGGLGIASHGIANALVASGNHVTFFIPKLHGTQESTVEMVEADTYELPVLDKPELDIISKYQIGVSLMPYLPPVFFKTLKEKKEIIEDSSIEVQQSIMESIELTGKYGANLMAEIQKYGLLASLFAKNNSFDLVHVHDWMTFKPGILVKALSRIPLVVHVHSTEIDRNGSLADPHIIEEERNGFEEADAIITVSNALKSRLMEYYDIPKKKIVVIPNGYQGSQKLDKKRKGKSPVIGFVGRLVNQKGPFYFVDLARELLNHHPNVKFEVIGGGYLEDHLMSKVLRVNMKKQFTFHGFLSHEEALNRMRKLDILIVPSLAEPFGLVALEAVKNQIAVVASKGAGITEFVPSIPTCEPWDIYNFVNLVSKLLVDPDHRQSIIKNCFREAEKLTWDTSARQLNDLYRSL